jgi:hypothetical protein
VHKLEPSYKSPEDIKWFSYLKNSLAIFQKVKHELTFDQVISLLSVCWKELKAYIHTQNPKHEVS